MRNIVLLVLVLLLVGGGVWYFNSQSDTPEQTDSKYISQDLAVCDEILWTCPPHETEFIDANGCGCEPTEAIDDIEYRSLDALVQRYLAQKVMQPNFGGQVFANFKFLDNVANEQTGNVEYNIWALISEYYPNEDGTLIKQGTALSAPIKVEIEETGRAYIIRGYELPADGADYTESVKQIFSQDAQNWIFDQGEVQAIVIQNLVNNVRSQASMSYALPIDDSDTLQEVEETETEDSAE